MAPEDSGLMGLFARMRRKVSGEKARGSKPEATALTARAIARRMALAAESIAENERLTADLDDEAAKVLIDWGIACAKRVVQQTSGLDDAKAEQVIYPSLRATREMMRSINNWIAEGGEIGGEGRVASLDKVIEHAAIIYGKDLTPPTSERRDAFLGQHLADTPRQLIASLRALIEEECVPAQGSSDDKGM